MDTKETTKKRNKIEGRSIFDIISEKIFFLLSNGLFGRFFTSYDEVNNKYLQNVKRKRKTVEDGKIKKKISRTIEKSVVVKYFPRLVEWLLRVSTNNYGATLFTVGMIISMSYLLSGYVLALDIPFYMLISGLSFCLIGLPLIFSKKSISENIIKSKLCNAILFVFLGLDKEKMRHVSEKSSVSIPSLALICGLLFSFLSYFVPPFKILLIVGILILSYCVLLRPETGVVATIIMLPFVSVTVLQISVLYVLVCYTIKCMLGKRSFKFEQFDIWVVVILFITLIRGAISVKFLNSMVSATTSASIILFYFAVTNLIRTKKWFRRCLVSLVFSGIGVAAIGIFQAILGELSIFIPDIAKIFTAGQSAIGTFLDPNTFAHYLVAIIPFSIVHFISERGGRKKANGIIIGLIMLVALCLANSLSGIVGIIVATLLLLSIYNRNFSYLTLAICVLCPILYFTLPQNALKEILSIKMFEGVSLNGLVLETRESFKYILEKPFGIGLGEETFNFVFGTTEGGVDNLVLQNMIEYGVIISVVFVIFVLMFMRLTFSYCVKAKNQYRKINCCVGFCAVIGLIASGIINYTWYDKRIMLVFWILVALSFAYVRIEREEEEPEGLVDSYVFATLDIAINNEHHAVETKKRKYVRVPKINKKNKKTETDEKENQRKYEEFENSSEFVISSLKSKKPIEIENTIEIDIIKDIDESKNTSEKTHSFAEASDFDTQVEKLESINMPDENEDADQKTVNESENIINTEAGSNSLEKIINEENNSENIQNEDIADIFNASCDIPENVQAESNDEGSQNNETSKDENNEEKDTVQE